jgi:multimeric flavodoxin WrbA
MKVFGISGGRDRGNSEILLKQAFIAIEKACGAEIEFIRLLDTEIKACTGCEGCMTAHSRGDWDFRCVHGKDEDHFFFIETKCREADAIIFSLPVYNLQPPGLFMKFLNKLHASGDYRNYIRTNSKVGAAIMVGGTDWTNFGATFAGFGIAEFCDTFDCLADQMTVQFCASSGAILLDDEAMARATRVGENVATALISGKRAGIYGGEEGVCPVCHGNLLEYRGGELWCPMCEMKSEYTIVDGKIKIAFSEQAITDNRWGVSGQDFHFSEIRRVHKKASDGREIINEKRIVYDSYKEPLALPVLKK